MWASVNLCGVSVRTRIKTPASEFHAARRSSEPVTSSKSPGMEPANTSEHRSWRYETHLSYNRGLQAGTIYARQGSCRRDLSHTGSPLQFTFDALLPLRLGIICGVLESEVCEFVLGHQIAGCGELLAPWRRVCRKNSLIHTASQVWLGKETALIFIDAPDLLDAIEIALHNTRALPCQAPR